MINKWKNNPEIQIFREYLMIPSIVADEYDYAPCVEFIKREAAKLVLPVKIYYPGGPTKPILILEWEGTEPDLPKILLSSHMDVAKVDEKFWINPPFAANIDEAGRIIARGSQDMKCSGMQYLAAIRALKSENVKLKRTVLVIYVPHKQDNGKLGMKLFVPTNEFKDLNIGFTIDEGWPTPYNEYDVFYAERPTWHLRFNITGEREYGSSIRNDIAGEKVRYLINKFMDYRATELKRLETHNPKLNIGDVTSINLCKVQGEAPSRNVVITNITLCFDCHLATTVRQSTFEQQINQWIEEAGGGIDLIFDRKDPLTIPTIIEKNKFWEAFQTAITELNLKVVPKICPFSTDARFFREIGIPAIGFSALNNTPTLMRAPDEFLHAETYLRGIKIWKKIILHVANTE